MSEKINNHSAHYCGQSDIAMEMLADRLVKAKCDSKKIPWILMAFKYFNRLGAKDDIGKELDKIANYVHRVITGGWRKETPVELVKYATKESTEEPKKEYPEYQEGVEYLIDTILHLDNEGIVKVEKGKGCSSCVFWETICNDRKCIAGYRADKQDIYFSLYGETKETK